VKELFMSASLKFRVGALAAGLCCLVLTYAVAQQVQPRSDRAREGVPAAGQTDRSTTQQLDPTGARAGERTYGEGQRRTANFRGDQAKAAGANRVVEHYLANCLLAKNKGEVELSEIAKQKSDNPEVKQFAEQMIQDHGKLVEQLQPLAGMQQQIRGAADAPAQPGETTALPGSPGAGQTIPPTGTTAAAPPIGTATDATANVKERIGSGGAIHQLMQIEKQIGDHCLQNAKDELQQKSGVEFDKCYVGMALGAHMQALSALEVIGQQPGQLGQIAQQAQPTVQKHLEHAKQLMKQLEGQSGGVNRQAERPSARTE
jgi:predicted outer membrane protein